VLPLRYPTGHPDDAYLADGVLIALGSRSRSQGDLAHVGGEVTRSKSHCREIGDQLGVGPMLKEQMLGHADYDRSL
jgi:hypothetical protein